MADVLTYTDFWYLTFLPVLFQSYVLAYTIFFRRLIGDYATLIRGVFQSILLITYGLLMFVLVIAQVQTGQQPIEFVGFWIAFVLPNALAILSYLEVRHLKVGLTPDNNPHRDRIRDAARDTARDTQRDIDRDAERDMRRDLYRDREKNNDSP